MKKGILLIVAGFAVSLFFVQAIRPMHSTLVTDNLSIMDDFTISPDIQPILDKSCFGCHNSGSSNDKGKAKLMIDKMGELSKAKLVGAMGEISDVVKKKEMPPAKFLEKYPDKQLTEEESQKLVDWTSSVSDEMMK